MKRALAAALLMLAAGIFATAPAHKAEAKPAVLNADQMRAFGFEALTKGFAEQALTIAGALLARDPADSSALVLQAQALRVLHRLPESEAAARAAWAAAKDSSQRYWAATSVAQALSLQDHRTLAQYWLRQAVQNAPTGQAQQQAVADFNYVREQNPLTLNIQASLRPSANVTNGSRDQTYSVYDPFFGHLEFYTQNEQKALSGVAGAFGVSGQYRLAQTERSLTALTFSASTQVIWLSRDARAKAPGVRSSDYSYGALEIGLSHRMALGASGTVAHLAATIGHDWYGDHDLSNYGNLEVGLERPVSGTLSLEGSLTLQRQVRIDRPQASSGTVSATVGVTQRQKNGDALRLTYQQDQTASNGRTLDTSSGVTVDWQKAKPVAGMQMAASLSLARKDFPRWNDYPEGRHDVIVSASLAATLVRVNYLGFAPVLSLTFNRNGSNTSLNDTQNVGVGVSVRSRF